jgi:hypothetical protein
MFLSLTLGAKFFSMPPVYIAWRLTLDGYLTCMPSKVMLVSRDWMIELTKSKRYEIYLSQTLLPMLTDDLAFRIKYPLLADKHHQVIETGGLLHCSLLDAKGQVASYCTMVVEDGYVPQNPSWPHEKYRVAGDRDSGGMPKVLEGCNALIAYQPTAQSEVTLLFFSETHLTPREPGSTFVEFDTDVGDHRVVEMLVADDNVYSLEPGPWQLGHEWFYFVVTFSSYE